jgi:hypothetical protein
MNTEKNSANNAKKKRSSVYVNQFRRDFREAIEKHQTGYPVGNFLGS